MPRSFGVVQLDVGLSYINSLGRIVTIAKCKVRPASWVDKRDTHYFVDTDGQRYWRDGTAMKSNAGGLPPRALRNLTDRALAVKVGQRYDYHWPDRKSVGHYRVTALDDKGYSIVWSNGAPYHIQYGCPLNYDSVLVG